MKGGGEKRIIRCKEGGIERDLEFSSFFVLSKGMEKNGNGVREKVKEVGIPLRVRGGLGGGKGNKDIVAVFVE